MLEAQRERRKHFRRQARSGRRVPVEYAVLDGGPAAAGGSRASVVASAVTRNIGVGGAFIESEDPPPPGARLHLSLPLHGGRTLELRAEVRWIADGDDDEVHGMGVRFHGLDEETREALGEWLAALPPTLDHDDDR